MKVVFSQEIPNSEFNFKSDKSKFLYLGDKLRIYKQATEAIFKGAKEFDYDLQITKPGAFPSRNRLYFNGDSGKAGVKKRIHIVPFSLFVRDLVCLRSLLEVHDLETSEAENFESQFLDYTLMLDGKGFIPPVEIRIDGVSPEKVIEAYKDVHYQQITAAQAFIDRIQTSFEDTWMSRIEKNTGNYDSNHIMEKSYVKILE